MIIGAERTVRPTHSIFDVQFPSYQMGFLNCLAISSGTLLETKLSVGRHMAGSEKFYQRYF
jgi:hypothetical protein